MIEASFVSLFPESTRSIVSASILGRAVTAGQLKINEIQIRDFATNKHKTVDDTPYGGGPGQVMKVDVVVAALRGAQKPDLKTCVILSDAAAKPFTQADAKRLAAYEHLIFVCGRYEGIDARIEHYVDESFSIGEYILTGGELPALVMLDAITRYVPGVLGNPESLDMESHADGLVEHRQYTRPVDFEGHTVPEVLLSGNHQKIEAARLLERQQRTVKK
ncbi:MAG: tRNA (guanosine(37)-N1)-methyltransferase TrmD [Myxococcota bacterium]